MRLRHLAVLAAAGLFIAPALAQQSTPPAVPVAAPPRTIAPPKPCDAARPANMTQLLNESEDLRQAREEFHRFWMNNQPSTLTYERLHGAKERTILKSYAVADLVTPPPHETCCPAAADNPKTRGAELIKKITSNVEPKSWASACGQGSIEYFPMGMALVVNHTPDVQTAVARYLDSLRKLQDQQVTTQLYLVTVSDAWFEKYGLAKEFWPCAGECAQPAARAKIITAEAVARMIQALQDDPRTNFTQAPKITTLTGQPARLKVGDTERFVTSFSVKSVNGNLIYVPKTEEHEMGVHFSVEPTVQTDGNVRIAVSGLVREHAVLPVPMTPLTTVVQPVPEKGKRGEPVPFTQFLQEPKIITRTVTDTVVIPDGGSALFYGGSGTVEETIKERLPTLSDVPVLASVFARDKKVTNTNHLLVVLTAHVVRPDSDVKQCAECCPADGKLSKLLSDYKQACGLGKVEEARRLAIECLAIDPTCFGKK